jgi:uncharacterized protein
MREKLADPTPFAFAGFAFVLWMLSMINAGWFTMKSMDLVVVLAVTFGGTALAVSGLLEFVRGNTFNTVLFMSFGAFWWSLALYELYFKGKVPEAFTGWYLALWGVFALYMWIASFKTNPSIQLFLLALWITFGLLAIGAWGATPLTYIGGYTGLITAVLGFYYSAATIFNDTSGHEVIPSGRHLQESEA